MHRTLIAVFTTLVLGGAALLSCSDRSGTPTEADRSLAGSTIESDIQTLITALFGKPGGLNTAANSQWKSIQKTCTKQPASLNCQTKALNLIDFTNDKLAEGKLKDPPNDPDDGVPDDTEDAALLLQLLLLEFAGFDVSGIDPEAEDLVIVVCQPGESCLVVTPNGHSGVFLPAGACDAPCTIVGQKIDETVFFPTDGPLPTPFDQFPLFYDWRKLEAGETPPPSGLLAPSGLRLAQGSFNVPIEIALCVVEAGLYAPDPDVVAQLQLAHPDPDNADTIELLAVDPTPNVTLDCTNATAGDPPPVLTGLAPASRRLTLASPGPLGAKTSSFSPFAAVDPESGSEPELFADGFESGLAWTATGFWNRTTGAGITNILVPTHVLLAPDDTSGGALPSAPEGTWYAWYGQVEDGNFIGDQVLGDAAGSGGTSTTANSGSLTSPAFTIPATLAGATLRFDAWFEIEAVAPSGFDQMIVSVIDVEGDTVTELGRLNPASPPAGAAADQPFTSAGFNAAPVFLESSFPLDDFIGREIQIVVTFTTGDVLYNGFRGWIVDDFRVEESSPPIGLASFRAVGGQVSSLRDNLARCGSPVCPEARSRD